MMKFKFLLILASLFYSFPASAAILDFNGDAVWLGNADNVLENTFGVRSTNVQIFDGAQGVTLTEDIVYSLPNPSYVEI